MSFSLKNFLSHDAGPFAQFVKYGVIGVASTLLQMGIFLVLAVCWLQCLKSDDWSVRAIQFMTSHDCSVDVSDGVRGFRFAVDTACGFTVANVFCWIMNRLFVFRPGRYRWYAEFGMFFGVAGLAMGLATGISWVLIHFFGLMTTLALVLEVTLSFLMNYFARKYFIFNR